MGVQRVSARLAVAVLAVAVGGGLGAVVLSPGAAGAATRTVSATPIAAPVTSVLRTA